jgi:hypothetical protein
VATALDATTGAVLWQVGCQDPYGRMFSLAVDETRGMVYATTAFAVGAGDGPHPEAADDDGGYRAVLYGINATTGAIKFTTGTDDSTLVRDIAVDTPSGTLFTASVYGSDVRAFSPSGDALWRYHARPGSLGVVAPPAAARASASATFLVWSVDAGFLPQNSTVYGIISSSGDTQWYASAAGHGVTATNTLAAQCLPAAGGSAGACVLLVGMQQAISPQPTGAAIAAYDGATGKVLWTFGGAAAGSPWAASALTAGPVLDAAGCVYAAVTPPAGAGSKASSLVYKLC